MRIPMLLAVALLAAVGPARAADLTGESRPMSTPLPRSTPEAQGISSQDLLILVQEAEKRIDALHSFVLVRHGHVVAEGWWAPYAADQPHLLFSLSKSFTSTSGAAVTEPTGETARSASIASSSRSRTRCWRSRPG